MAKNTHRGHHPKKGDLTREFGRIVTYVDRFNGEPVISRNNIKVFEVLDMLRAGHSDRYIRKHFEKEGLSSEDIDACRAYQARFLEDTLLQAFNTEQGERYFMLDENITYMVLPDVIERFGPSSHVLADKLYDENNDDEANIWAHVVKERYKAVLTADDDFHGISRRYRRKILEKYGSVQNSPEHVPAVIYINPNGSKKALRDVLARYEDDIKKFVEENDAEYALISKQGFERVNSDKSTLKKIQAQKNRPRP